ncbi:hypothetical protein CDD83_1105 [Cordyceps sp. RAO-2017]|nr:hypothetical protein CDD83_1105 [Cordyceps sp. RAO-2017]
MVESRGGRIRYRSDSDLFRGVSAQLDDLAGAEVNLDDVKQLEGVLDAWPVHLATVPEVEIQGQAAGRHHPEERRRRGLQSHRKHDETAWTHVLTQVDKLRREGFAGTGVKIAVVDTGVGPLPCRDTYCLPDLC